MALKRINKVRMSQHNTDFNLEVQGMTAVLSAYSGVVEPGHPKKNEDKQFITYYVIYCHLVCTGKDRQSFQKKKKNFFFLNLCMDFMYSCDTYW